MDPGSSCTAPGRTTGGARRLAQTSVEIAQYGHSGVVRPDAASSRPRPSVRTTFRPRLRTNHGSWATWRASWRRGRRSRSARYSVSERDRRRSGTGAGDQLAGDRRGDADRGERVVDQQRPAVGQPAAPVADVGPGRAVAVGAVDVQHVDRVGDGGVGDVGEAGDVAHPVGHAGPARLASNTARSLAASSTKPSISCGPGRCRRAGRWRRPRRRRAPPTPARPSSGPEAADLDDPPTAGQRAAAATASALVVAHPPSTPAVSGARRRRPRHRVLIGRTPPTRTRRPSTPRAAAARGRWRRPLRAPLRPARGRGCSGAAP